MTGGAGEQNFNQLDDETVQRIASRINSVVESHAEAMQSEIVETVTETMDKGKEATHELAKFGDNLE